MVSERDLFALQRLSLQAASAAALRAAADLPALIAVAPDIRRLARDADGAGPVGARS